MHSFLINALLQYIPCVYHLLLIHWIVIVYIIYDNYLFSANGRLSIVKKCGLSPCSLSEYNSWTDECDRKADEDSYTCTSCCRNSLCNGETSVSRRTNLIFILSFSTVIFHKINTWWWAVCLISSLIVNFRTWLYSYSLKKSHI